MNAAAGAILLFFSGTIAFVPERPGSNLVNALLINVAGHNQRLRVPIASLQQQERGCPTQGGYCSVVERTFCQCPLHDDNNPLNDVTVSILNPIPSNQTLPTRPPGRLPVPQNVGSIGWLVNMGHVKPDAARVVQARIQENAGGTVSFNWHEAATCIFEEAICIVERREVRRVFAVRFPVAIGFNREQAVPESVVFKSMVSTAQARIRLKKESAGPVHLDLKDCLVATGCPVFIVNSMVLEDDSQTLCNACSEDRDKPAHFREFRRLTNDVFGAAPHRLCGGNDHKDLPNTSPPLCTQSLDTLELKREVKAISNRVICPSATMVP